MPTNTKLSPTASLSPTGLWKTPRRSTANPRYAKIICAGVGFTRVGLTRHKMSDGGRGRALLGVKVRKSSQKWSVRRSAVRSIAWLGLCGFIGGRGATIGAQLHNKFFAILAIAHILSCKLES